jgi:hypothetical protein
MFNRIRIKRFHAPTLGVALAAIMICNHVHAKDDPDQDEESRQKQRLKDMSHYAEIYKIFSGDDRKRQFKFHEDAVFRFSNPVVGTKDGAVYLWSDHGRPQAVIKFWTHDYERYGYAMQSLSERPLLAEREGKVKWNPTEPGITFRELSAAPKPAESASARLRQMKSLAERYRTTMTDIPPESKPLELRLLVQPLYRYETGNDGECLDGAVFAFATGTAPHVLLLFEARPTGKSFSWYYAFARLTDWLVTAKCEDKEVFSAEKYPPSDPKRTYIRVTRQLLNKE